VARSKANIVCDRLADPVNVAIKAFLASHIYVPAIVIQFLFWYFWGIASLLYFASFFSFPYVAFYI
jgi:hypothetical protein